MKYLKWVLLFLVLVFFIAFAATGQTIDDGHEVVISSMPDGANVLIDGVSTGQTTPMELHRITPGKHVVTVSAPGWVSDTRTITVMDVDVKGNPRDTHLSFNLLPVLTVGPKGDKGDKGDQGAPSFIPGPAGQSIVGQTGPQGVPGQNGKDGIPGIPGVNGTNGIPGTNGINGQPGRSPFQGVWSASSAYQAGDEVITINPLPDGATEKPGPYFYLAVGDNGQDPGNNPAWTYCCGNSGWTAAAPPPAPASWSGTSGSAGFGNAGGAWCFQLVSNQQPQLPRQCPQGGGGNLGTSGAASTDGTGTEVLGHPFSSFSVMLTQDNTGTPLTFELLLGDFGPPQTCSIPQGQHSCSITFGPYIGDSSQSAGIGVLVLSGSSLNGAGIVFNASWNVQ